MIRAFAPGDIVEHKEAVGMHVEVVSVFTDDTDALVLEYKDLFSGETDTALESEFQIVTHSARELLDLEEQPT